MNSEQKLTNLMQNVKDFEKNAINLIQNTKYLAKNAVHESKVRKKAFKISEETRWSYCGIRRTDKRMLLLILILENELKKEFYSELKQIINELGKQL